MATPFGRVWTQTDARQGANNIVAHALSQLNITEEAFSPEVFCNIVIFSVC